MNDKERTQNRFPIYLLLTLPSPARGEEGVEKLFCVRSQVIRDKRQTCGAVAGRIDWAAGGLGEAPG